MGWTSCNRWKTASDVRKEVVDTCFTGKYEAVDSSYTGVENYFLVLNKENGKHTIAVVLIRKEGGEFCYKIIDETTGPFYFNCPERILKKSDESGETATKWREDCRRLASMKKEVKTRYPNLKKGDKLLTDSFGEIEFQYHLPRGFAARNSKGELFRYQKSQIVKFL